MVIKRFTPSVGRIISLLPSDVGRPLTHFANNLRYERLVADVEQVLERLVSVEANIQTTSGDWYVVRILPYRTLDNYISGAVITFTDITSLKELAGQLQTSRRFAESIVETVREPLLVLDGELRIVTVSPAFATTFGVQPEVVRRQLLANISNGVWQQPELFNSLYKLLSSELVDFENLRLTVALPELGERHVTLYGRRLLSEGNTGHLLLGVQTVEALAT